MMTEQEKKNLENKEANPNKVNEVNKAGIEVGASKSGVPTKVVSNPENTDSLGHAKPLTPGATHPKQAMEATEQTVKTVDGLPPRFIAGSLTPINAVSTDKLRAENPTPLIP